MRLGSAGSTRIELIKPSSSATIDQVRPPSTLRSSREKSAASRTPPGPVGAAQQETASGVESRGVLRIERHHLRGDESPPGRAAVRALEQRALQAVEKAGRDRVDDAG